MPIKSLLESANFGPEEISRITEAFAATCKLCGLADRDDPLTEMVAKAIVKAAQQDASSAERIQNAALKELNFERGNRS